MVGRSFNIASGAFGDTLMRRSGCSACTGHEHENWSRTYEIMKICDKAMGVSW